MPAKAFKAFTATALVVIMETFCEILLAVINELKIAKASDKVVKLMEFAKKVPFTDSPEQAQELFAGIMS